jgi:hypothetical protein
VGVMLSEAQQKAALISAFYLNSQAVSARSCGGICLKIHRLPIGLGA